MAHVGFHWTPEATERLRVLWLDEGKTSSECARIMGQGLTRNSIIGRTHRCGWSGLRQQRPVKRKPAKKVARSPKPKAERPQIPDAFPDLRPPPEPTIGSYTLMDLKSGHCKWPEGNEPASFRFCGAPVLDLESYCPEHFRRAHQALPGRTGRHFRFGREAA